MDTQERTDHGMGVTSVRYGSPDGHDDGSRTYTVTCGACQSERLVWTTTSDNIASNLSDADWWPSGGYANGDADQGAIGAFWLCSRCGPYATITTPVPAGIIASMQRGG